MKRYISYFLSLFLVFSCVNKSENLDVKSVRNEVSKKAAIIIDVREKNEIDQGMLKIAKWYPLSKISNNEDEFYSWIEAQNLKKVYIYCKSGGRASRVDKMLKAKNIDVENIGGFNNLVKNGFSSK